jgi:hypothetical protein
MSRRFSPGRRAHAGTCLGEAFFDLAGRETVELTIPDGADIRGDLRQMQSLILGLKAEPCDEVRRDGNDFFSCRIKEWQAHCLTNRRSRRASETRTASRPDEAENGSTAVNGIIGVRLVLIQDARVQALRYNS